MTSQDTQLFVISHDRRVHQACRRAVGASNLSIKYRAVHTPERLPSAISLNDWLLVDFDHEDLNRCEWSRKLRQLSGQTLATGSPTRRLSEDYAEMVFHRHLDKAELEHQLGLLLGGVPGRKDTPDAVPSAADLPHVSIRRRRPNLNEARHLADFARDLAVLDSRRIAGVCVERLSEWLGARLASFYLHDESRQRLCLAGQTHPYLIDTEVSLTDSADRLMVLAARSRRLWVVRNRAEARALSFSTARRPYHPHYQTDSCIIAPLISHDLLLGVLNLSDPSRPAGFGAKRLDLIEPICRLISTSLWNAYEFKKVQHQARTDGLTGLPNRRTFQEQLKQEFLRSRRYGAPLTLAMIDLDGLKEVNDIHGHPAGDAVLKEVSRRIRSTVREIDLPARYGGDEFAVILPNTTLEQAQPVAGRLAQVLAQRPCLWQGQPIRTTISIGLCQYDGQASAADLIAMADNSLYLAKARGRNCVASEPAMRTVRSTASPAGALLSP